VALVSQGISGMSWKAAKRVCLIALVGGLLAACGVRGGLEYPNDPVTGGATPTATAESAQGKPEGAAPKPHRSSVLDVLIR
jgi:predicted small lipoprotein YifL